MADREGNRGRDLRWLALIPFMCGGAVGSVPDRLFAREEHGMVRLEGGLAVQCVPDKVGNG